LSAGDIEGDGDTDLLLGTQWLEQTARGWVTHRLATSKEPPDRNVLVDMNGDGRLDAVVGFEAISKPGRVVWYENPPDPRGLWVEHEVAKVVGPMSLAVVDVDGDGDLDIIVGEHNLVAPHSATLWYLENRPAQPWRKHRIWTGDEHHDGLVAFDLDGDGDVDFASVGWGHGRVHVYESLASPCRSSRR
jgi:hypothetical protein